ncbi:MAG: hypothetical protein MJ158_02650 [Alphaproteobacteria bacterium]|nr:hypothetical protein [Alphaproteobacteria bacterium]
MRSLTKTGIRILSAKYRSILIKCAIINASVFIGAFGAGSAFASDLVSVTSWAELATNANGTMGPATINIMNDITRGNNEADIEIVRELLTIDGKNHTLSGNGAYYGLNVAQDRNLTLQNITMKKFIYNDDIGAIGNCGTLNLKATDSDIKFEGNSARDSFGGAIFNGDQGTVGLSADTGKSITFIGNAAQTGGAIYNGGNITTIASNFSENSATNNGGAIYNAGTIGDDVDGIFGNFKDNIATKNGGAIYNASEAKIMRILSEEGGFTGNLAEKRDGGAIKNEGTITSISSNFTGNTAKEGYGGAIYSSGNIGNITGVFKDNEAKNGGAITNSAGIINDISGDFEFNSASASGGAIQNQGTINNIKVNFKSNSSKGTGVTGGGAIHNTGSISSIVGNFESNSASVNGGAIFNTKTITKVTGNFTNNSATNGGAVYNFNTINFVAENDKNITFDGNYVTAENGLGGAIYNYNEKTVGLYADANHSITFLGKDKTTQKLPSEAKDVDGIYNTGILYINGDGHDEHKTTGTVNLYNVSDVSDDAKGQTYIYGGTVNSNGNFTQKALYVDNAKMKVNGVLEVDLVTLTNSAILGFGEKGGEQKINTELGLINSTVNLQNNSIETLEVSRIELDGENQLLIDADLAGDGKIDQLRVASISAGVLKISGIKLLSDATQDKVSLSLFVEGTDSDVYSKVSGELNGLKYSPIYIYDAKYSTADGKITFTRTEQANPYLYAPSTMAQTTASITGQIAGLAMDKLYGAVTDSEKGLAAGDMPKANNAWVKVMGLNDDVEFNNFENIDSKAFTVVGGYNTNKITCGDCGIVFGAYAGYIGGKQKYTDNDIDQNGGYVGLSSALTLGDAFLTATVNGGLLKNKANNMYGTDRFSTLWLGTGLKTGYNYAITDSVVLQPNVYGGYTLVNTKDYTSVSGVKIATNNLNFFEVDPGLKLSAVIADGWTGSVQGKYAIVMDNGADITANDIALQNISTKNYVEYGIGIDKSVTDAFYLGAKVNRHDVGRTGWNGSIEFRYEF